jgi:hypothetical protein
MNVATKSGDWQPRVPVLRSFAPARIERQLLAQVFEIVQQHDPHLGAAKMRADASAYRPSESALGHRVDETLLEEANGEQLVAREAAA